MKYSIGLKKNADFSRVYRRGKSKANKQLVMYILKRQDQMNRMGISVSKKVGNSVIRHRIKRRMKEIYRLNEEKFGSGYDIVFIARNAAAEASSEELRKSMFHLAGLHHITNE
ncbi:MAG: ribonuclease P protein component [Lachnospiraceae bacterium]|nr:ribonuclease P protein component [Lachnospiraceae bacterium]